MNDLVDFLDRNHIKYSTQRNMFGDLIVDIDDYEIGKFDNDIEYTIAEVNTMNFKFYKYKELIEWLEGKNEIKRV